MKVQNASQDLCIVYLELKAGKIKLGYAVCLFFSFFLFNKVLQDQVLSSFLLH